MYLYTYLPTYPTVPSRYLCTAEVKEEDQFIGGKQSHISSRITSRYCIHYHEKINHTHPATSLYRP